jgi:hypothetical protein
MNEGMASLEDPHPHTSKRDPQAGLFSRYSLILMIITNQDYFM